VFITKMSPTGSSLIYSTYLGGDEDDTCSAIAVDAAGSVYVTGTTLSQNFPIVGAFQPTLRGFDAFITKLTPGGSSLIYSTFLGGFTDDAAVGLALDQSQNAYVVGGTLSADFPTVNPLQQTIGGNVDVFVAKLRTSPELQLTMTGSPDPVNFGSNLTYTINVKNNGEVAATGVTVNDTLPPGAMLVSATSTVGACTGTTSISCSLGTINPGATSIVTVIVTPPAV